VKTKTLKTTEAPDKKGPGRPRSTAVEAAILQASFELMLETSVRDMTMDAISHRAGVSKATLYKWWPSKLHLGLDALLSKGQSSAPVPDTGSAIEDFRQNLKGILKFYTHPKTGPMLMQLWGECLNSQEMLRVYRERFFNPRRAGLYVIYERGVARGDIDPAFDVELVLDLVYGPIIMRLLTGHGAVNESEADLIVQTAFVGISPR